MVQSWNKYITAIKTRSSRINCPSFLYFSWFHQNAKWLIMYTKWFSFMISVSCIILCIRSKAIINTSILLKNSNKKAFICRSLPHRSFGQIFTLIIHAYELFRQWSYQNIIKLLKQFSHNAEFFFAKSQNVFLPNRRFFLQSISFEWLIPYSVFSGKIRQCLTSCARKGKFYMTA